MFLLLCLVLMWSIMFSTQEQDQLKGYKEEIVELRSHDYQSHSQVERVAASIDVNARSTVTDVSLHNSVEELVLQLDQDVVVNDVYHVCEFDQTYDTNFRRCRRKCSSDETFYRTLGVCVRSENYSRIKSRPLCKNITIPHEGFDANISSDILAKLRNWILASGSHYMNDTKGVTVCYPFSLTFMTCRRWGLDVGEYEVFDDTLRLSAPVYRHVYDTEDFYINDKLQAVVCFRNQCVTEKKPKISETVLTVGCSISAVSLFFTICIFAVKNQWKYHTKILLCHILSLFVFYTVLVIRTWFAVRGTTLCTVFGILLNFTFLAAFFWINVLAYDIWKNLSKLQINPLTHRAHHVKFLLASVYAWGLPLLISGSAVAVNYLTPFTNPFNPAFSLDCWLSKLQYAHITFMYAPAAAILAVNLMFYVLTVFKLRSLGQDATVVNTRIRRQLFKTYLKLMVVMGVCWIMEIVSGIVADSHWYWYFTDVINCLQGFFIFIIYFCKRSVLRAISRIFKKSFGLCCCQENHRNKLAQCCSAQIICSPELINASASSSCDLKMDSKHLTHTSCTSVSS